MASFPERRAEGTPIPYRRSLVVKRDPLGLVPQTVPRMLPRDPRLVLSLSPPSQGQESRWCEDHDASILLESQEIIIARDDVGCAGSNSAFQNAIVRWNFLEYIHLEVRFNKGSYRPELLQESSCGPRVCEALLDAWVLENSLQLGEKRRGCSNLILISLPQIDDLSGRAGRCQERADDDIGVEDDDHESLGSCADIRHCLSHHPVDFLRRKVCFILYVANELEELFTPPLPAFVHLDRHHGGGRFAIAANHIAVAAILHLLDDTAELFPGFGYTQFLRHELSDPV